MSDLDDLVKQYRDETTALALAEVHSPRRYERIRPHHPVLDDLRALGYREVATDLLGERQTLLDFVGLLAERGVEAVGYSAETFATFHQHLQLSLAGARPGGPGQRTDRFRYLTRAQADEQRLPVAP